MAAAGLEFANHGDLFIGTPPPDSVRYPDVSHILCKNTSVDPFRPAPIDNTFGNCNSVGLKPTKKD